MSQPVSRFTHPFDLGMGWLRLWVPLLVSWQNASGFGRDRKRPSGEVNEWRKLRSAKSALQDRLESPDDERPTLV